MSADYWSLTFDADGGVTDPDPAGLLAEVVASQTSDLFVMSHGWGNSTGDARYLYDGLFGLIGALPDCPPGARFLGVFWPSLWFPEQGQARAVAAGTPGQADAALSGKEITATLAEAMPEHARTLARMGTIIDRRLADVEAGRTDPTKHDKDLLTFHALLGQVFPGSDLATEDGGERSLIDSTNPKADYQALSRTMKSAPPSGDVQSLGDIFGKVWNGAKDALRVGSYYQMKSRAGDVGRKGLGPFLERLHAAAPGIRVHLIGHSFGARLVSYALAGTSSSAASPIGSLSLVQGAFSHWVFTQAADNPFGQAGALCAFTDRVHGPMVATFTAADWAVGTWYPKASFLAQQDVEGTDPAGRWDGMGSDGFQQVRPQGDVTLPLGPGTSLEAGTFYRADANSVITDVTQSSFAGAHSDIRKDPVAALIVAAARAAS